MFIYKELEKSVEEIEDILICKKLVDWDYLENLFRVTSDQGDYEGILKGIYRKYLYSKATDWYLTTLTSSLIWAFRGIGMLNNTLGGK